MDWKKDYRNIFCTGKKCQCHKEVEDFISETLKERDREIKNLIAKEILKNKNLEVLTGLSHALNIINKNIRKINMTEEYICKECDEKYIKEDADALHYVCPCCGKDVE